MSRIAWRLKSGATKGTLVDNEAGAIGLRDGWNYPGMSFEPWRVVKVRILTPAESRRKAAAEALRALAESHRLEAAAWRRPVSQIDQSLNAHWRGMVAGYEQAAGDADRRADALWPRKGAGR